MLHPLLNLWVTLLDLASKSQSSLAVSFSCCCFLFKLRCCFCLPFLDPWRNGVLFGLDPGSFFWYGCFHHGLLNADLETHKNSTFRNPLNSFFFYLGIQTLSASQSLVSVLWILFKNLVYSLFLLLYYFSPFQLRTRRWQDEMVGWHHWLNGHEFEQAQGDSEGQGSLMCCSPLGLQRVRHNLAAEQQSFLIWGVTLIGVVKA